MAKYQLVRPVLLSVDEVAARSGLHPDLVRRFAAMSLVDSTTDVIGRLRFTPKAVPALARVQRLRTGLALNYAAIGLVLDLLDRIEVLEAQVRSHRRWT
ncbi:chaperone modulator CbpM [Actinokineospora auranticolor]|uniref:MerR-like DNA binding protein n=1 Tax=Actinokineospora auranticolor TaxID=155976 RepID=A0A2S6GLZ1_9PSEU|nr:chaperone modulator CbpM [Actinokineospora auranticolor]PPK66252.1 MerR-like DNA binding protein [Actinokineospora auranticolor]